MINTLLLDIMPPEYIQGAVEVLRQDKDSRPTRPGYTWVDDDRAKAGGYWRKLPKGAKGQTPQQRRARAERQSFPPVSQTLLAGLATAAVGVAATGTIGALTNAGRPIEGREPPVVNTRREPGFDPERAIQNVGTGLVTAGIGTLAAINTADLATGKLERTVKRVGRAVDNAKQSVSNIGKRAGKAKDAVTSATAAATDDAPPDTGKKSKRPPAVTDETPGTSPDSPAPVVNENQREIARKQFHLSRMHEGYKNAGKSADDPNGENVTGKAISIHSVGANMGLNMTKSRLLSKDAIEGPIDATTGQRTGKGLKSVMQDLVDVPGVSFVAAKNKDGSVSKTLNSIEIQRPNGTKEMVGAVIFDRPLPEIEAAMDSPAAKKSTTRKRAAEATPEPIDPNETGPPPADPTASSAPKRTRTRLKTFAEAFMDIPPLEDNPPVQAPPKKESKSEPKVEKTVAAPTPEPEAIKPQTKAEKAAVPAAPVPIDDEDDDTPKVATPPKRGLRAEVAARLEEEQDLSITSEPKKTKAELATEKRLEAARAKIAAQAETIAQRKAAKEEAAAAKLAAKEEAAAAKAAAKAAADAAKAEQKAARAVSAPEETTEPKNTKPAPTPPPVEVIETSAYDVGKAEAEAIIAEKTKKSRAKKAPEVEPEPVAPEDDGFKAESEVVTATDKALARIPQERLSKAFTKLSLTKDLKLGEGGVPLANVASSMAVPKATLQAAIDNGELDDDNIILHPARGRGRNTYTDRDGLPVGEIEMLYPFGLSTLAPNHTRDDLVRVQAEMEQEVERRVKSTPLLSDRQQRKAIARKRAVEMEIEAVRKRIETFGQPNADQVRSENRAALTKASQEPITKMMSNMREIDREQQRFNTDYIGVQEKAIAQLEDAHQKAQAALNVGGTTEAQQAVVEYRQKIHEKEVKDRQLAVDNWRRQAAAIEVDRQKILALADASSTVISAADAAFVRAAEGAPDNEHYRDYLSARASIVDASNEEAKSRDLLSRSQEVLRSHALMATQEDIAKKKLASIKSARDTLLKSLSGNPNPNPSANAVLLRMNGDLTDAEANVESFRKAQESMAGQVTQNRRSVNELEGTIGLARSKIEVAISRIQLAIEDFQDNPIEIVPKAKPKVERASTATPMGKLTDKDRAAERKIAGSTAEPFNNTRL